MRGRATERVRAFVQAHRKGLRRALILAAVAAVFFWIGANAPRSAIPLMCRIYG